MVVVEVDGPFVRVVEVAHLTVVVDVQAGVAAVAAGAEGVHAVALRREGVPKRRRRRRHGAVICRRQRDGVVASLARSACKNGACRLPEIAAGGHGLAIERHHVLAFPVATAHPVPVGIENFKLDAWLLRSRNAQRVSVHGITLFVRASRQHHHAIQRDFPGGFSGVAVGQDVHNQGAFVRPALGERVEGKRRQHKRRTQGRRNLARVKKVHGVQVSRG